MGGYCAGILVFPFYNLHIDKISLTYPILISDVLCFHNLVEVPTEIVSWSTVNRERVVRSMNKGTIAVYSGRGMVIGCAEAGKTTLVNKLKGKKNITTTSTKGIEIHVHEFKLDAEERTIISK